MPKNNNNFFEKKNSWSEIKDQLLGSYLVPYFSKIMGTRKNIFYVDGFAGKGKFNDGKPGSPIIALDIINDRLQKSKFSEVCIKACFIELNHAKDLRVNIENYNDVNIISGKYEDNIEQLLQGKQQQNVFLYIDPYGIKSLHFSVFDKLHTKKLNSVELLMNMNSFGFIREACNAMNVKFDIPDLEEIIGVDDVDYLSNNKSIQDLNKVAGGDYWQKIIDDYKANLIDGYEAERRFTEEYCANLNKVFEYVLNMPIRFKKGQRPKYRMIHATNHADGCVLMNDSMCKCWEALIEIQNSWQQSFFDEDAENNVIDEKELRKLLILKVNECHEFMSVNIFLSKIFMYIGVKYNSSTILKLLKAFEKENIIEVDRYPKTTQGKELSTFMTEGKGRFVKIRSLI